jgi:hypothetical protein
MPATLVLMEAHARHVSQGSGKARQELVIATPARLTRTHLSVAMGSQTALATRAGRGPMEARVLRVWPGSTRHQRDHLCAAIVWQGHIL